MSGTTTLFGTPFELSADDVAVDASLLEPAQDCLGLTGWQLPSFVQPFRIEGSTHTPPLEPIPPTPMTPCTPVADCATNTLEKSGKRYTREVTHYESPDAGAMAAALRTSSPSDWKDTEVLVEPERDSDALPYDGDDCDDGKLAVGGENPLVAALTIWLGILRAKGNACVTLLMSREQALRPYAKLNFPIQLNTMVVKVKLVNGRTWRFYADQLQYGHRLGAYTNRRPHWEDVGLEQGFRVFQREMLQIGFYAVDFSTAAGTDIRLYRDIPTDAPRLHMWHGLNLIPNIHSAGQKPRFIDASAKEPHGYQQSRVQQTHQRMYPVHTAPVAHDRVPDHGYPVKGSRYEYSVPAPRQYPTPAHAPKVPHVPHVPHAYKGATHRVYDGPATHVYDGPTPHVYDGPAPHVYLAHGPLQYPVATPAPRAPHGYQTAAHVPRAYLPAVPAPREYPTTASSEYRGATHHTYDASSPWECPVVPRRRYQSSATHLTYLS